jgi:hypothetical protein
MYVIRGLEFCRASHRVAPRWLELHISSRPAKPASLRRLPRHSHWTTPIGPIVLRLLEKNTTRLTKNSAIQTVACVVETTRHNTKNNLLKPIEHDADQKSIQAHPLARGRSGFIHNDVNRAVELSALSRREKIAVCNSLPTLGVLPAGSNALGSYQARGFPPNNLDPRYQQVSSGTSIIWRLAVSLLHISSSSVPCCCPGFGDRRIV